MIEFLTNWVANTPAFAVPFALGALGLIITEKSGVLSLGAEGFMLVGAMVAVGTLLSTSLPPEVALLVGAAAAAAFSLIFAVMVVGLRVHQVIAGLTMVFLAQGLTGLIATQEGWTNRAVSGLHRMHLGPLQDLPLVGPLLFQQDILVYLTLPIFVLISFGLGSTMVGLRLRAVGDGPAAADAAGINISAYRFGAIFIGAFLVGLAGAYLSIGVAKVWVDGMSGGRGWIAIALVIFARWSPWKALLGAVIFGGIEALIPRVAAIGLQVPQYLMLMMPYLVTIAVMCISAMRGRTQYDEPLALGKAHLREERT